jgi:hypothetical protein
MARYKLRDYNTYIKEDAEVLDSIIYCFDNCRVKYLGSRLEADAHFKRHFPDVVYRKFPEKLFYREREYPKFYGIIDIERGYRFRKAG